jgi:hypothetical protein
VACPAVQYSSTLSHERHDFRRRRRIRRRGGGRGRRRGRRRMRRRRRRTTTKTRKVIEREVRVLISSTTFD